MPRLHLFATPVRSLTIGALLAVLGCGPTEQTNLSAAPASAPAPAAVPAPAGKESVVKDITISAPELYNGFEARKVLLDKQLGMLVLDGRVFTAGKDREGRVVTDVIDMVTSPGGLGNGLEVIGGAEVEAVVVDMPQGAAVKLEVRTGTSFFDQSGWSQWQDLGGLKGKLAAPVGRYLQVRLTLKAAEAGKGPQVVSVIVRPDRAVNKMMLIEPMTVTESKVQQILRSPVDFQYERLDQAKLAKFRKDNDLDGVVAGKYDELLGTALFAEQDKSMNGGEDFIKLVRLMDWVGHCTNDREKHPYRSKAGYAWDIEKVFQLVEVEKDGKKTQQPTIYGHCMSYSEVLTTAAAAMGYSGSRHMCMVGFREASHEICDIWVPSLGKWVYFDPSLTNYYFDKATKKPMNLIEMHKLVAEKFVPEGKDMNWWIVRASEETRARVREVGGKAHIGSRLGPWSYGTATKPDYDWGWYHGYLAAGFVQMTPRNDFHSHPEKASKRFENWPGYDGYPFWVDEKTPPFKGVNEWFTRMRDFYWTLDQASFRLTRTGEDEIAVELGNSMPFFKKYVVKVDGKEVEAKGAGYAWKLKAGANRLEVAPVDEFGKTGLPSSVTVKLGK